MGKRRGFGRNHIPKGLGDWKIFVFNCPQGRGFGWGFVVSRSLKREKERKGSFKAIGANIVQLF